MAPNSRDPLDVGVDTGGTFTDVVLVDEQGRLRIHKLLSTPDDPSRAIGDGVSAILADVPEHSDHHLIHGTTVATNALLERDGARVALVTTAGFEDLLFLRRQNRPELYRLHIELPEALVRPEDCVGVDERMLADGRVERPLEPTELERLAEEITERDVDAVAVCLLHSYANSAHEELIADHLERELEDVHLSVSSDVVPEFREYERASTTAVNAYVGPVMSSYLDRLDSRVDSRTIEMLLSSGGRSDLSYASSYPVHTVLSGPAGGVIGALASSREIGIDKIISFDMGGTSTDVSLCDGGLSISQESEVGGLPVHVPVIDIHTVGAGGGSIAYADPGGALRVGPRSAGADPGPACYGGGGSEPTVTDAHVHLGRVRPDRFLGGTMQLDREAATRAVTRLADELGMGVDETARGILDVADASMVRALKVTSLEKGYDPREFGLVSFGGAGAMHACRLASELDMSRVIVPRNPGLLSAFGMLDAEVQRMLSTTLLAGLNEVMRGSEEALRDALSELEERAVAELSEYASRLEYDYAVDLRYEGQSFELRVPVEWEAGAATLDDPSEAFETRHEELYGYRADGRSIELVAIRLRAFVPHELGAVEQLGAPDADDPHPEATSAEIGFADGDYDADIVARAGLSDGDSVEGPCVVTEYSSTTVVPDGWNGEVVNGHLLLERESP